MSTRHAITITRLFLALVLLWACTYGIVRELSPDPAAALGGLSTDEVTREYLKRELKLDQPYVVGVFSTLASALRLDFGRSTRSGRPALNEAGRPLLACDTFMRTACSTTRTADLTILFR